MNIHYNHLLEYLDKKPSIKDLSLKLFQLGHEHEVENEIFKFEFTPNRGDCLSVRGLARDLNPFFGYKDNLDFFSDEIPNFELDFFNQNPDVSGDIWFLKLNIEPFKGKYQNYLESYFKDLNLKKINLLSDISNYVLYEMGQPTHCYDFEKIEGIISFKKLKKTETFLTLHGDDIKISDGDFVFSDDKGIINLAGIMGGKRTSCSSETSDVLIECAAFSPDAIIGRPIKYNLKSESAYKFERGIDKLSNERLIRRFIQIVEDHTKINNLEIFKSESNERFKNKYIKYNKQKIKDIIGIKIDDLKLDSVLHSLHFELDENIKIPSFRNDIEGIHDIAEEVSRVIGYDNIPIAKRDIKNNSLGALNSENKIRHYLSMNGATEVINYPFSEPSKKSNIFIDNPLDKKKNSFRSNLEVSLVTNLIFNERRQNDSIFLFEISDIYNLEENQISHDKKLGIIASGRIGNNYLNFNKKFKKETIEKLISGFAPVEKLLIKEINRSLLQSKIKEKIFYFECKLSDLSLESLDQQPKEKFLKEYKYKKISEFPSSHRDFSLSIIKADSLAAVIKEIDKIHHHDIKECFIFDFYKNQKNDEIKLGFRIIFQSLDETLTDEKINHYLRDILEPILKIESVTIPGLQHSY
tara:strand:- start:4312 stop:6225 length:1914 start_codon:yes stop_codon:yes gene_type:complete